MVEFSQHAHWAYLGPAGILYEQLLLKCPGWQGPPVPLATVPKLSALGYNLAVQPGWGCHPQRLMVIFTSPTITQKKWCLKQSIIDLEYMCSRADPGTARHLHTPGRHRHVPKAQMCSSLQVLAQRLLPWTSAFPATMPGTEHGPLCGHGLVLSLCLCLLRHSSATSHHHPVWGTGVGPPAPMTAAKSLDRSLSDSQSEEPQVSERAVSSHLQGSVGFLCSAQQAAHSRGGAESTAAIPSTTAGPAMPRRHSERWAPVFPRIPPPAKCPPNPSLGDAHQYTTCCHCLGSGQRPVLRRCQDA